MSEKTYSRDEFIIEAVKNPGRVFYGIKLKCEWRATEWCDALQFQYRTSAKSNWTTTDNINNDTYSIIHPPKQPTFEEKYVKALRDYTGSTDSAHGLARLIASYVQEQIDKLRREINNK